MTIDFRDFVNFIFATFFLRNTDFDKMKCNNQFGVVCVVVLITLFLCCTFLSVNAQDSCFQKADPGICRASIPRFFFNSRSGRCDSFLYGGCGGNSNNFRNMGECNSFRNYCLRRRGGRF